MSSIGTSSLRHTLTENIPPLSETIARLIDHVPICRPSESTGTGSHFGWEPTYWAIGSQRNGLVPLNQQNWRLLGVSPTFPRWILVGRCCTLPMTKVQPLDWSIKDFPAPASTPSRLGSSNLLPTRSAAQTCLSGIPDKSHCAAASTASPRCRCKWTGPKPCDTPQNLPEQLAWDRHFGHLERHVLRVLCHLGTDLHQLLPQCCERPVLHVTGQRQTAQEVGQVVGQGEQLQANLVVGKAAAGKPSPLERVLALLDPLFGRARPL